MEIVEQVYYRSNSKGTFRPFSKIAEVSHKSYSSKLQRVMVYFGADNPFGKVNGKLKEHYDIEVPDSAARNITLKHAEKIHKLVSSKAEKKEVMEKLEILAKDAEDKQNAFFEISKKDKGEIIAPKERSAKTNNKDTIISETDGVFVPIVETYKKNGSKRKGRNVKYKEARLTMAHKFGDKEIKFGATMKGVNEVGKKMLRSAEKVGLKENSIIHAVGDGAKWIQLQVKKLFGKNSQYLIDFYHLCEYIAAAAPKCADIKDKDTWIEEQKALFKNNKVEEVLVNLEPFEAKKNVSSCPVIACSRYIKNRMDQFNYKDAIANDLPIGSGEVESAHRYVIQGRLKIPGAWWLQENAEKMPGAPAMIHYTH
jgi:hypothetical protein